MTGLSDYSSANVLNYISGALIVPALPSLFLALFTTAPTSDAGTGGTEVSGGSYARQQIAGQLAAASATGSTITFGSLPAWVVTGMQVRDVTTPGNVPANTRISSIAGNVVTCNNSVAGVGTDTIRFTAFDVAAASTGTNPAIVPGSITNTNATITFPQASASWGTVTSWGIYDASSAGNLLAWDYLGNFKWLPFSCTLASPGVLSSPAHGYSNGDPVIVTSEYGGTLPTTGSSFAGVLTVAGVATDTFNVGVNTTSTGDGLVRKIVQQSIPINVTASFATGTFVVSAA